MKFIPEDKLPIENVPRMKSAKCKFLAFCIFFALVFLPVLTTAYIWYLYDWVIAIGGGLFLYLVSAIVSSKLRLSSLPPDQRERSLSSMDIAKWYVDRHFCFYDKTD